MARAKGFKFLTELTPIGMTAEQEAVCTLTDTDDIQGVAWSPKYRAWRAYLHVGRKQVHHSLHQTKAAAIEARREAERRYGKPPSKEEIVEWIPAAAFRRHHRAPKVAVRKRALLRAGRVMRDVARLVNRASAAWPEDEDGRRCSPMTRKEEVSLARRIGQVLALVEYLRMTGDLRIEEVEDGMRIEVQRLLKHQV